MARLSAIGVRRLRALYDLSTPIEFRPITVLIGRNSVGKSTFARLLPLLRQSAERKKRGPIIWFDDLVDFGTLPQATTRGESDIEFVFEIEGLRKNRTLGHDFSWTAYTKNLIDFEKVTVAMTLACEEATGATYASKISINASGVSVKMVLDAPSELTSISVDGEELRWNKERQFIYVEQGSILPRLEFIERKGAEKEGWTYTRNFWRMGLGALIKQYVHHSTSSGTAERIANAIPLTEKSGISNAIRKVDGPPTWRAMRNQYADSKVFIDSVFKKLLASNIDALLEELDVVVSNAAKGVRYLKPLRATAERYYRRVDLSVSEIDPEGRNLPMFLDSLMPHQLNVFQEWLKRNLDIELQPERQGAQVVLMARGPNDSGASNVADMGFGVSQMLPIAAQLWASSNVPGLPVAETSFVVIEQPELHLHPAFQARIADVLAGVAVRDGTQNGLEGTPPRIIVETHSQHIVNRLGLLIEQGRLKPSDVSIVLFEANEERPGTSQTRVVGFNNDGVLQNWPFGFFEPDF